MLKNKIHPYESEDLIGFIKQFMNWAVTPLTSREMLQRATEREMILKAQQRSHNKKKKGGIISGEVIFI